MMSRFFAICVALATILSIAVGAPRRHWGGNFTNTATDIISYDLFFK